MPEYDVAQICENGHVVNDAMNRNPEDNKPFCKECGQRTMSQCNSCNAKIEGHKHYEHVISMFPYSPPKFCNKCGKPYPWTEKGIGAAKQYASEIEGLSDQERELLTKSIDDIVTNSPYRQPAFARFKKILGKVKEPAAATLSQIVSALLTEGAKKSLGW